MTTTGALIITIRTYAHETTNSRECTCRDKNRIPKAQAENIASSLETKMQNNDVDRKVLKEKKMDVLVE